jgi:hypothetical protein
LVPFQLAVPVVAPGQDGAVALQGQGVKGTAGDLLDLRPAQAADLDRPFAVVGGFVAQLTSPIVAPGPEGGDPLGAVGGGGGVGGANRTTVFEQFYEEEW